MAMLGFKLPKRKFDRLISDPKIALAGFECEEFDGFDGDGWVFVGVTIGDPANEEMQAQDCENLTVVFAAAPIFKARRQARALKTQLREHGFKPGRLRVIETISLGR